MKPLYLHRKRLAMHSSFEKYARKSRREQFLSVMDAVVPWRDSEALIEAPIPRPPRTAAGGVVDHAAGLFSGAVV